MKIFTFPIFLIVFVLVNGDEDLQSELGSKIEGTGNGSLSEVENIIEGTGNDSLSEVENIIEGTGSLNENFAYVEDTSPDNTSVNEIANSLVSLLGVNLENASNPRFKDLQDKLNKIDSYVVDKDKYAEILRNESKDHNLNQTTFYEALNKNEEFDFLFNKDPKNVYLQMKEKINRDDLEDILERHMAKSARKMMIENTDLNEAAKNNVIDEVLAKKPEDNHKFNAEDFASPYWDPQVELEGRKEHLKSPSRRIYKGERTSIRDYPFVVSIQLMKRFWCGGSLYSYDIVLTSAACLQLLHNNRFFRENPMALEVRLGTNHSRIGGELIQALEVFFHPSYNPRTLANNIAIIRLQRHLFYTYHRVPKLIRISENPSLLPATVQVLLLGWGLQRTTAKLRWEPVFLQRKFLPVYPNYFCQEVYGKNFITSKMFCAGTMTTGEGACDHDAGGPAILDGYLVGIISFGPAVCGFPNAPTVFTLVGAYADWIQTINASMPHYYHGLKRTTTTQSPFKDYDEEREKTGKADAKNRTTRPPVIVTTKDRTALEVLLAPKGGGTGAGGAAAKVKVVPHGKAAVVRSKVAMHAKDGKVGLVAKSGKVGMVAKGSNDAKGVKAGLRGISKIKKAPQRH